LSYPIEVQYFPIGTTVPDYLYNTKEKPFLILVDINLPIDQSGKGLLTQTIEGNGVISVASLPAGLYYLKNTSTNVTQKVIIAK
jgi:hypothetical protein